MEEDSFRDHSSLVESLNEIVAQSLRYLLQYLDASQSVFHRERYIIENIQEHCVDLREIRDIVNKEETSTLYDTRLVKLIESCLDSQIITKLQGYLDDWNKAGIKQPLSYLQQEYNKAYKEAEISRNQKDSSGLPHPFKHWVRSDPFIGYHSTRPSKLFPDFEPDIDKELTDNCFHELFSEIDKRKERRLEDPSAVSDNEESDTKYVNYSPHSGDEGSFRKPTPGSLELSLRNELASKVYPGTLNNPPTSSFQEEYQPLTSDTYYLDDFVNWKELENDLCTGTLNYPLLNTSNNAYQYEGDLADKIKIEEPNSVKTVIKREPEFFYQREYGESSLFANRNEPFSVSPIETIITPGDKFHEAIVQRSDSQRLEILKNSLAQKNEKAKTLFEFDLVSGRHLVQNGPKDKEAHVNTECISMSTEPVLHALTQDKLSQARHEEMSRLNNPVLYALTKDEGRQANAEERLDKAVLYALSQDPVQNSPEEITRLNKPILYALTQTKDQLTQTKPEEISSLTRPILYNLTQEDTNWSERTLSNETIEGKPSFNIVPTLFTRNNFVETEHTSAITGMEVRKRERLFQPSLFNKPTESNNKN